MKRINKFLTILCLIFIILCIPVSADAKTKMNKTKITISVGKKYKLSLSGVKKGIVWKTNNKKIATVSKNGTVSGKKKGTATITAKVKKRSYKCKVTVKNVTPKLTKLTASNTKLQCGKKNSVTFSVKKQGNLKKIYLYDSKNKKVGLMHDDGKKGDKKKNDGIYSLSVKISRSKPSKLKYYTKSGKIKSSAITIYSFSAPSAAGKKDAQTAMTTFTKIQKKYQTSNGTVSSKNARKGVKEATTYAKKLVKNGQALYYEANSTSVTCKMSSGLTVIYQPYINGYDSIGANVSMSIVTFQPCRNTYSSDLSSNMAMPDEAANTIAREFSNYTFKSNLDDSSVSLENIKSIGSNQIIIWHGHGGYNTKNHSFLVTGEKFDWNKWLYNPVYWWDCVQDRILESSGGRAMITSKFISKYCKNMNNSLIYLAACQSGKDSTLADAFLNKGASAVVANSETIYTKYNTKMEKSVLTTMATVNPNTNNYYTLNEALTAAKRVHGNNDGSENRAYPKIYGGTTAKNYRFGDVKPGKIDGKVISASNRNTPIPNAKIEITQNNKTIKTVRTNILGSYTASLSPGSYRLKISATGYLSFSCYVTVESGQTKYMESFLMINGNEADKGTVYGYISHGTTGQKLSGVTLQLRKDWNNPNVGSVVATTKTNSSGYYEIKNLPIGHYTAVISKSGFITTNFNVLVQKTSGYNQNAVIAEITSSDSYQIVLTWGDNPRDLDSHVTGTLPSGSTFHTYFGNKTTNYNGNRVCNLDVDKRYGSGPETITLNANNSTPYYYYVYKFTGNGDLYTSGAQVKVYKAGQLISTYNVPTNQGTGRYWNIFAIVNGKIITNNTITSSANTSYAGLNQAVTYSTLSDISSNTANGNTDNGFIEGTEAKD